MKMQSPTSDPVYLATKEGGHTHVIGPILQEVPSRFRAMAMAAGCRFEGQKDDAVDLAEIADTQSAQILVAVKELIDNGGEDAFTQDGKVSATALTKKLGFTVTGAMRDVAWEAASKG